MANGFLVEFCYSIGIVPLAIVGGAVRGYISFLYTDIFGLSPTIASVCWTLFCIVSAVMEPYCGFYSDRSKPSKMGKHLPWILYCFIPWLAVVYMIWNPPASLLLSKATNVPGDSSQLYLGVYYGVVLCLFGLLSAAVVVNYHSSFSELFTEDKRARITGMKQSFAVIGTIFGIAGTPMVAKQDWSGRTDLAYTIVCLSVPVLLMYLGACIPNVITASTKQEAQRRDIPAFVESVSYALKSRAIFYSCLITCVLNLGFAFLSTNTPLWSKYVLGIQDKPVLLFGSEISPEAQNAIIQMSITIFALLCIPASLALAKKYGNEFVFKAEVLMCAVVMVAHVVARDFHTAMVIRIVLGFACSGLFVLPEIFLGEAIEQDSKATGVKRSGMIYGTNSLLIHVTSILIDSGKAAVLNWTGYQQPTATTPYPTQSASAIFGIQCLSALIPAGLLVSAIVVFTVRKSAFARVKKE